MADGSDQDDVRVEPCMSGMIGNYVEIDPGVLGADLSDLILSGARIASVSVGDLRVYGDPASIDANGRFAAPITVLEAMKWGTKFFDARLYFSLDEERRPLTLRGQDIGMAEDALAAQTSRRLAWMAMYMMLRGSYPHVDSAVQGTDVPKFLLDIFDIGMTPKELADELASFPLNKINPMWIKMIDWSAAGPEFGQRLGLAVAGYRILGMFRLYEPKRSASAVERAAYVWIQQLAAQPPDYSIMSITRSPTLISRLGPWNKNLYSAVNSIFSDEDIADARSRKIIPAQAVLDTRTDNWKHWPSISLDFLNDPVKLADVTY